MDKEKNSEVQAQDDLIDFGELQERKKRDKLRKKKLREKNYEDEIDGLEDLDDNSYSLVMKQFRK